jgi:tetratricopeptide (TPR) repeat protein
VKIWDASSPDSQTARRRRALALLEPLFQRLLLKDEVIAQLQRDARLGESIRELALSIAASWKEDPQGLNDASWEIVSSPDRSRADYDRALQYIEAACRLVPENGNLLNTLGLAQYRAGRYDQAQATLIRSDRLNAAASRGSIPHDLAFLAMTQHRLGHRTEALASLGRLRDAVKKPQWRSDREAQSFLYEAEVLIGAAPAPSAK